MSLTLVRPYIRERMNSLGHREWTDGFNYENIPSTILNRSYHLETGNISIDATDNKSITFSYSVIVRLFIKGYRKPSEAIDEAIEFGENAIADIVNPSNRIMSCIKNVLATSLDVISLNDTNDNSAILEMGFTAKVIIEI